MTYIIIKDRKLILEIDINEDLDDLEEEALDNIIDEEQDSLEYIGDVRIEDLTIEQTSYLYSAYEILRDLAGLDIDKLLLYWIGSKGYTFEVEKDIDIKELQREGYVVVNLKCNEEKEDNEEKKNEEKKNEEK